MSTEKLTQCARNVLDAWSETGWNVGFDAAMRAMREALAAHEALAAVPVEPRQITEAMHVAACKVLTRASGLDGTPQRMLDAMLAAAPQPQQSENTRVTPEQLTALRRGLHTGKIVPPVATPPQPTAPQQALQTRLDDYATEINRLRNVIQAACIGGTDYMIERWKNLFPDAPVPTVKPQQAGRDCPHCNYSGTAHCGDVAAQIKANGGEPGNCSNAHAYGLRSTPAQGACQHKRYTVDVREQTGNCIDCGAEGAMRFVVPQPQQAGVTLYAECRDCHACGHTGINDASAELDACSACGWSGPSQTEDRCPECGETGTMTSACPKCGAPYGFVADANISLDAAPPPQPRAPAARSDSEIVDQTEKLAALLADVVHGSKLDGNYRDATATRAQWCWSLACQIQELLTATDPENSVAELASCPAPAAQAQAVSQWRPIESAPKDGTRLLLWWDGAVREGWCAGAGQSRDGGDWWRSHSLATCIGRPTLWQPLPEAPTSAAQNV